MKNVNESPASVIYHEKISSIKTSTLFLGLMLAFLILAVFHWMSAGVDWLTIVLFILFGIFLFYVLNYRVLVIEITVRAISLRFGIFIWTIPMSNIAYCQVDEIPAFLRLGGAGIHFMFVRGRYRASFNFLEYPRVVIAFKKKAGLVRDISFTTRQPEAVIKTILGLIPSSA